MPILLLLSQNSLGQNPVDKNERINRKPAVAGKFYPFDADELKKAINKYFVTAIPQKSNNVVAIITPHAGYVYSGQVAASAFNQIDENKKYENVFIIGSSHTNKFSGASVFNTGNWETPLGIAEVNFDLAAKLIKDCDLIHSYNDVHRFEHSLEVEVPFLQHKLKNPFKIVPIILGSHTNDDCMKLAQVLRPYFTSENLFVISTDMSHYPNYEDAKKIDSITSNAILSGLPDKLATAIYSNSKMGINNLATSLCGWTSVLTMLHLTSGDPELKYNFIQYMNSGDIEKYGDKNRVVGYGAYTITSDKAKYKPELILSSDEFALTVDDKKNLIQVARKTLEEFITTGNEPTIDTSGFSQSIQLPCGAFVTLQKNGKLRGCIGRFMPVEPLWKVVMRMAMASSSQDTRFQKVTIDELKNIEIEISVLTPFRKIISADEFILGKQGIYMKKENKTGTFLPQVAKETQWTKEEFLGHCSRDKAGLGWDGWKTAELFTYEAIVFGEKE